MKASNQNDQVTSEETVEILRLAEQCLRFNGDFVELGCYRGDTSVLLGKLLARFNSDCGKTVQKHEIAVEKICKTSKSTVENLRKTSKNLCKTCAKFENNCGKTVQNPVEKSVEKHLWIYDSFAGLPDKTSEDNSSAGRNFQKGELSVTKREVADKIRRHGLHNIIIKKAWFDDLKDKDLPAKIAFAFLDGDLYGSIKTSLRLVVPRLKEQGIIIVHDYNKPELPGSSRAVDEFLRAHSEYHLQNRYSLAILRKEC